MYMHIYFWLEKIYLVSGNYTRKHKMASRILLKVSGWTWSKLNHRVAPHRGKCFRWQVLHVDQEAVVATNLPETRNRAAAIWVYFGDAETPKSQSRKSATCLTTAWNSLLECAWRVFGLSCRFWSKSRSKCILLQSWHPQARFSTPLQQAKCPNLSHSQWGSWKPCRFYLRAS